MPWARGVPEPPSHGSFRVTLPSPFPRPSGLTLQDAGFSEAGVTIGRPVDHSCCCRIAGILEGERKRVATQLMISDIEEVCPVYPINTVQNAIIPPGAFATRTAHTGRLGAHGGFKIDSKNRPGPRELGPSCGWLTSEGHTRRDIPDRQARLLSKQIGNAEWVMKSLGNTWYYPGCKSVKIYYTAACSQGCMQSFNTVFQEIAVMLVCILDLGGILLIVFKTNLHGVVICDSQALAHGFGINLVTAV